MSSDKYRKTKSSSEHLTSRGASVGVMGGVSYKNKMRNVDAVVMYCDLLTPGPPPMGRGGPAKGLLGIRRLHAG